MRQIPSKIRARDGPIRHDWFKLYQHTVSLRDGKPSLFFTPPPCMPIREPLQAIALYQPRFLNILTKGADATTKADSRKPTLIIFTY